MGSLFRFSVATRAALIGMFMAATLFGVAAREARADILVSLPSIFEDPALSGNWEWTYTVDVVPSQRIEEGDFFTIYDFFQFVAGSNKQPAGWAFASSVLGVTPDFQNPADDPNIPNLTWTFVGVDPFVMERIDTPDCSPTPCTTTNVQLGFFAADSTFNVIDPQTAEPFRVVDNYSTQGTADPGPATVKKFTTSFTEVPGNPVPEPGSMILLGTGLFGAAAALRRRRNTTV